MDEISGASLFAYRDEVLVEVTGQEEDGDIGVVTYQFKYADDDPDVVHPKQAIDPAHTSIVFSTLEENGYQPVQASP